MTAAAVLCESGHPAELVNGQAVYPQRPDLYEKAFWLCRPCAAWVGVHRGTATPLGTLAGPELRRARMEAHTAFDVLWKERGWPRRDAYTALAAHLGIQIHACHIGSFDLPACRRVVVFVRELVASIETHAREESTCQQS